MASMSTYCPSSVLEYQNGRRLPIETRQQGLLRTSLLNLLVLRTGYQAQVKVDAGQDILCLFFFLFSLESSSVSRGPLNPLYYLRIPVSCADLSNKN